MGLIGAYLKDNSQRWVSRVFYWESELNDGGMEWYKTLLINGKGDTAFTNQMPSSSEILKRWQWLRIWTSWQASAKPVCVAKLVVVTYMYIGWDIIGISYILSTKTIIKQCISFTLSRILWRETYNLGIRSPLPLKPNEESARLAPCLLYRLGAAFNGIHDLTAVIPQNLCLLKYSSWRR